MGFIVVLQGMRSTSIARRVSDALAAAGYDVCLAPQTEQGDLRENLVRCLISEAQAVVAPGLDGADPLIQEAVALAAKAGKLVEPRKSGGKGLDLESIAPPSVADMVAAVRGVAAPDRRSRIAGEYADFAKAAARGRPADWTRFLTRHRMGVLQPVAIAALAAREAQAYRVRDVALPADEPVWRTRSKRLPPAAVWSIGGIVAATAAAFVVVATPLGAGLAPLGSPSARGAIEPDLRVAAAAPDLSASVDGLEVANIDGVLAPPPPLSLPPPARQGDLAAAAAPSPVEAVPVAPPVVHTPPTQASTAPAPRPAPPERPSVLAAAPRATVPVYDLTKLEPGLRATVELARRRQAFARAQAQRPQAARVVTAEATEIRYAGDWAGGAATGLGRAEWTDGTLYEGTWRRSRPEGMGVMLLANGLRYEGEFSSGAPTGNGVFWSVDGRRLTGAPLFNALIAARRTTLEAGSEAAP